MNLFEKIVNENLLTELRVENDDRIIDAINNVLRVRIAYNDEDDGYVAKYGETIPTVGPNKGKNERYILPVAYGLTKSGKRAIRAYQSAGSSRRGQPHWKLFLLDRILYWSNGKKSFKDFGQTLINLGLNTSGDKGLTTLFAITPIANDNVQVANDTNPIQGVPVTKTDVTPQTSSQVPQTTEKEKFVNAQSTRQTDIDNLQNNYYTNNGIDAPPSSPIMKQQISNNRNIAGDNADTNDIENQTVPITKQQISKKYDFRGANGRFVKYPQNFGNNGQKNDINSPEEHQEYPAQQEFQNGPITKQDIDNESEKQQISENFKRMMDRMNNRYKEKD